MTKTLLDKKIALLLSGGVDSTALIQYYKDQGANISAYFINYNQDSIESENISVEKIVKYFNIPLRKISLGYKIKKNNFEYTMRNSLFINIVASTIEEDVDIIAMGIHNGTDYYDCSKKFISTMQDILDGYFKGKVNIDVPFIDWYKNDIFRYARTKDIPIEMTYSCEKQSFTPCGNCPSCIDRKGREGRTNL